MGRQWQQKSIVPPLHQRVRGRRGCDHSGLPSHSLIIHFHTITQVVVFFLPYLLFVHFNVNSSFADEAACQLTPSAFEVLHCKAAAPLWCAGTNTHKCMWLNIVSYYCLLAAPSEVNSKSLSLWVPLSRTSEPESFGFLWLSHAVLFGRFISNSYSCQTDLKLWNLRNVWFSPKPSLNQTELKLSTTCVQPNTCWLHTISPPDWTCACSDFFLFFYCYVCFLFLQ